MANRSAILSIRILGDATKATEAIGKTQDKISKFQSGLTKAAGGATLLLGGMAAFGKVAGESASRLEQAQGAVESIFGKQAGQIDNLAKKAAGAVGLAQSEYSELAGVLGAQLNNLGVSQDELVGTTDGLISKGADLAATFGGTTADAVGALTAAFRGETDPIEKYGISIKQADIAAQMAANGTDKLTGAAGKAAKTQATLDLITKQSASSQGQFARETDSAAGSAQIAAANWENAKAALGESLLPVMSSLATKAAEVAGFIQQNSTAFTILAGVVAGLAAAILVAQGASMAYSVVLGVQAAATGAGTAAITANSIALGAYTVWMGIVRAATLVWTGVQWALNAALSANPIALVVLAIAALVAGVIWAWNNVAWFRDGIIAAWEWIKSASVTAWTAITDWVTGAWQSIVDWFTSLDPIGAIVGYWNRLKATTTAVFNFVKAWVMNKFIQIITGAKQFAVDIAVKIATGFLTMKARAQALLQAFVGIVRAKFLSAVAFVRSVPGKILAALGNLGNKLRASGKALIRGFIDGIKSMIGKVTSAAKDVVGKVRDFFPFSPAKKGPLSGSGYTDTSGKRLAEDFATAMLRKQAAVKAAAAKLTGAATLGGEIMPIGVAAGNGSRLSSPRRAPVVVNVNFNNVVTDRLGVAREIKRLLNEHDALVVR